uniref:Serine/threonine-protein kinase OSR1-like n=1 Tax=Nicotiana tabacum TaxID=4097 RepID=A0A1S4BUX6_TOBAC|nr:PREDICTED: serine/threonine-protein kinase OSR1-like [Nicotiana tabacum]
MGRRTTRAYRPKVGRIITDPNTDITYLFEKIIGTSGLDFVYKAVYFSRDKHTNIFSTGYITVKYLRKGNPDIGTSFTATGKISTRNIINIESWFIRRFEDNGYLVGLPYMSEGSLRYILSSNFYYGLPEDCIAIALKEALIGLLDIHNSGRIHKYFNAGNIFVNNSKAGGEIEIKLAFEAAGYDSDPQFKVNKEVDAGDSSVPRLTNISAWAAAPEIYYTYEDSDDIENDYSVKSDIWLVGITALELAYGNIRVSDREDFDDMINKIRKSKKLPNKLEDLFEEITYPIEEEGEEEKNDGKMKKVVGFFKDKLKLGKEKEGDNLVEEINDKKGKMKRVMGYFKEKVGKKKEEERLFSKEFENVVLDCLAKKPRKRPNVERLLRQPFFEKAKDKNWFQRRVLHAKNPKPITSDSDSDD